MNSEAFGEALHKHGLADAQVPGQGKDVSGGSRLCQPLPNGERLFRRMTLYDFHADNSFRTFATWAEICSFGMM